MQTHPHLFILAAFTMLWSCENKDINDGEAFQPREIHEDIAFHFDTLIIDGIEYLILEKDNNNPHEGFGFMAFRANKLMEKQDTLLTYMRTVNEIQTRIYAKTYNINLEKAREEVQGLFDEFLKEEQSELRELQKNRFTNDENVK